MAAFSISGVQSLSLLLQLRFVSQAVSLVRRLILLKFLVWYCLLSFVTTGSRCLWKVKCCTLMIRFINVKLITFRVNQLRGARTRRFITALTTARHQSLSWASRIQSTPPKPISLRFILIPSSHLRLSLPSGRFPSEFSTKTLYTFSLLSCVPHALPSSFALIWSA
jgi:hypothetical protein